MKWYSDVVRMVEENAVALIHVVLSGLKVA